MSQLRNELSNTINRLIRLSRALKEMEKQNPAPPQELPSVAELMIDNELLRRKVTEVWRWKLENYSTDDIERELLRRRRKMAIQRTTASVREAEDA